MRPLIAFDASLMEFAFRLLTTHEWGFKLFISGKHQGDSGSN